MKLTHLALTIATATFLTACGGSSGSDSATASDDSAQSTTLNLDNVRKVLNTNADIAYAAYSDAVTTAEALQTALATFRADPTAANLEAAKKAWLVAREPYGQTEVFRFRLSPIDSSDYSSEDGPEGDINAWPLGEALIDYVKTTNGDDFGTSQIGVTANEAGINGNGAIDKAYADANSSDNIIGNTSITIDADLLAHTATADDEHDVIAGYHAIEFLLWGQDLNSSYGTTDGTNREDAVKAYNFSHGGQRPLGDFQPGYTDGNYDSSVLSQRRHKYLEVAAEKLVTDLTAVRNGWAAQSSYRTEFTTVSTQAEARQKLTEILTGMGTLSEGELAGERMQIAFATNSQEDEHSCFSDNTHRDIAMDALGIANAYYGDYAGYDSNLDGVVDSNDTAGIVNAVSGYGIDDLLADAGLTSIATQMDSALTTTRNNYTAIDAKARAGEPFDVLIMDAKRTKTNPVYLTIGSLNAQSKVISAMAEALGIDSAVVDPDASECDTSNPDEAC